MDLMEQMKQTMFGISEAQQSAYRLGYETGWNAAMAKARALIEGIPVRDEPTDSASEGRT